MTSLKKTMLTLYFTLLCAGLFPYQTVYSQTPIITTQNTPKEKNINEWLNFIGKIKLNEEQMSWLILNGELPLLYSDYVKKEDYVKKLKKYQSDNKNFDPAIQNLKNLQDKIINFYITYTNCKFLGDENFFSSPPVAIIILGTTKPMLNDRLETALDYVKNKYKDAYIILSGGGNYLETEANLMYEFFIKHGISPQRLIKEEDSLDTVGNALFSYLTLQNINVKKGNILLVTSDFHSPRALFLFRNIFPNTYKIALATAQSSEGTKNNLVRSELSNWSISLIDLFSWEQAISSNMQLKNIKGMCSVFYNTLAKHKLYTNRPDLMRKYNDECNPAN